MVHRAWLVSAAAYASSTLATRRSQWRVFLHFCLEFGLAPLPASSRTVILFLIHLSSYCKYSKIINYVSGINVFHRHFGHDVTFHDAFAVKIIVCGLRPILGDAQKLPITPDLLLHLRSTLLANRDSGFWASMLIGFYSFFLKSNLVSKSTKDYDPTTKLRYSLSLAGLKAYNYSGHSFRHGGATFPFHCGAPVELISLQGDWSSEAVLLYIAQPRASVVHGPSYRQEHFFFLPLTLPFSIHLPFFMSGGSGRLH